MKRNRNIVIASCLVCLLPLVLSAVLYSRLPEQMAIHWGMDGEPNGYASRFVGAFALPLLMLVLQLLCCAGILHDPKKQNQSAVARTLSLWVIPVLSLIIHPITLLSALGKDIPIPVVITLLIGILFIITGNYLPKSRQNYTIGIKLPWTLSDADNWNRTHRLAGPLWIICGCLMIISLFLPNLESQLYFILVLVMMLLMVLIPAAYSFLLYRKKCRENGNPSDKG